MLALLALLARGKAWYKYENHYEIRLEGHCVRGMLIDFASWMNI